MWKNINITKKANSEYVLTNMTKIQITGAKKDLEFTLKITYMAKNGIVSPDISTVILVIPVLSVHGSMTPPSHTTFQLTTTV